MRGFIPVDLVLDVLRLKHNTMGTVGTELRLDYARHAMQNTFEKSFIGTQS